MGGRQGVCPYYASRAAVPAADVILLPYSALLSQVPARNCSMRCSAAECSSGRMPTAAGPTATSLNPRHAFSCHFLAKKFHSSHAQDSILVTNLCSQGLLNAPEMVI